LPPIAKAGADTNLILSSCSDRGFFYLDARESSDPDGTYLSYSWRWISGPPFFSLRNANLSRVLVQDLPPGNHAFELSVKDIGGLTSKDTMLVSIKGARPKEYNLDISVNSPFFIHDNVEECYYKPCSYFDLIEIIGKGTFDPLGDLNINVTDYSDSAASKFANNSGISIYNGHNINSTSIHGTMSVNLKKLIQQGGGPFTGTFTIEAGSATRCDDKIFDNLPPLTVTGNLDTTSRRVTLNIKGKAFF
jgi:hypothetical protein